MTSLPSHHKRGPLTPLVGSMIRVNHAGEFSAKRIYDGQLASLKNPQSRTLVHHMAEQEARHLEGFEELARAHEVPLTRFLPLWDKLSYGLGFISGALGAKAAMACTTAVEEVIETHYQHQLQRLQNIQTHYEKDLQNLIGSCLEDEQEHLTLAIEEKAEEMPCFSFLKPILQLCLKTAISLSERV